MSEYLSRTRVVRLGEIVEIITPDDTPPEFAEVLGMMDGRIIARYMDHYDSDGHDECFVLTDARYVS